jgi:DNA-binding ferritin-like protein (Dps family)
MAKFDLKKAILENKATFFSSLTEGQFSWMTQDTGQQIGSQDENQIPVYMFDNTGKYYYEPNYDGYGVFGGKDYYELLDQMNGGSGDRERGIDLAFGKEKTGNEILFPALVTSPSNFNYKNHDFTKEPESDPNQSWYEPEEDDFYDQNDEEVFGDMDKEEDYDYSDEEELEEVKTTNTKMKKSEFKNKIKEMILKEMEDEKVVDVNDETPESEEDFLAELEGMLNEASEFDTNKPARIAAFIKDLDALMDEYHAELYLFGGVLDAIEMVKKVAQEEIDMLNEAEGDEEVTDDVTTDDVAVDDTETIDTTTTTEVNPDVKAVQDSLTQAQAAAQKLGDPKLTDQIGNTITFFTRNHVVEKGAVAEADETTLSNLQYVLDWWEELPFEKKMP